MDLEAYKTQTNEHHEQLQQARNKLTTTTTALESALRERHEKDNEMVMMAARLQSLHDKLQTHTSMEYRHTEMGEKVEILKSQNKEMEENLAAAHGSIPLPITLSPYHPITLSIRLITL